MDLTINTPKELTVARAVTKLHSALDKLYLENPKRAKEIGESILNGLKLFVAHGPVDKHLISQLKDK